MNQSIDIIVHLDFQPTFPNVLLFSQINRKINIEEEKEKNFHELKCIFELFVCFVFWRLKL